VHNGYPTRSLGSQLTLLGLVCIEVIGSSGEKVGVMPCTSSRTRIYSDEGLPHGP
jgi:hypothetical protein